jgi:type IV pilus assembly protein PilQ
MDTISALSVRNADVANLLRGIGEQYSVNLIVEDRIQKKTTIRLSQISVLDALQVICQEQDLSLVQTGPVFRIRTPPEPPPEPPSVTHENGRITMDLSDDKLTTVAETLTKKTGTNVIVSDGVDGTLNGYLERVPLESGLSTLLTNNGYTLRKREDILVIDRQPRQRQGEGGNRERRRGTSLQVNAEEGEVDLDVREAPVQDVLSELAARMNLNLVTYKPPQGRISATVEDMSLDQVFDLLFRTSNVTYRRKDSTYFVGTRKTSSIATTELISLNHVKAKRVPEMLPQTLKKKATIKVISEHNGLMMTGANNAIEQLRSAVEALDKPTPLILIEALVVDFPTTDLFELGLEFGQDAERSEQAKKEGYRYGEDGFQLEGEDQKLNQYLKDLVPLTSNFGIRNIGELPKDFFLKLRALSQEGKVDIRSRPQVAALSGHTASIEIGQTQYFILRKETPVQSPEGGAVIQETERFEKIEANVSLEITPWVTSSGEVTTEIRPEFSQPVGEFNAEKPPTINTRILESTVRLKEGETIILGGLVRDRENVQYNKIPVLGSIPWLGKLFSSRTSNKEKSELVIYLTPHVFYGSKDEPEKWQQLREQMDLRDPREKQ